MKADLKNTTLPPGWEQALTDFEQSWAAYRDLKWATEAEDWAAHGRFSDAWWTVIDAKSPDLKALAYKLGVLINRVYADNGQTADDEGLMLALSEDRSPAGAGPIIAIYRDVLRLAGLTASGVPRLG
ncbi:MAG: hypothetical protein K2X07_09705 [Caulobacteraceae bacterium]|nr:hypothetical protein [Caulobacteraceae bacterium]